MLDDSHLQIHEYLQLLDSLLNLSSSFDDFSTPIKKTRHLNQTNPTLFTDYTQNGNATNLELKEFQQFWDQQFKPLREDSQEFESFLIKQGRDLCFLENPQKRVRNQAKKVKYIEKHSGPEHAFSYNGVRISVCLMDFLRDSANIALIPYQNEDDYVSLLKNQILIDFLSRKINTDEQVVGNLRCINPNRLRILHKFNWFYLHKKPHSRCLKEQAEFRLREMLEKMLQKSTQFATKKITIPYFQWPRLTQQQKSKVILSTICNFISKKVRTQKVYLKQIRICYSNPQGYLSISNQFQDIINQYIKQGPLAI